MGVSLPELLEGFVTADAVEAISVSGVSADSRNITANEVFFALPGTKNHGDTFAGVAVENGAIAVVSDRPVVPDPGVAVVVVDDVRAAYAKAAVRVADALPPVLVGVTGTSGKTSVASFVRQIWQHGGFKSASIGTLGIDIGGEIATPGMLTTPDSLTLAKSLAALKSGGVNRVVVEASSHGLDQRRLDGLKFNAVGFTNLSHDHLDYHADMDDYREAKLRLFRDLLTDEGYAIVNSDDPEHMPFMFAALDRGATLLTVGEEGAYIEVESVEPQGMGQRVKGKLVGEDLDFVLPLVGRFQVDNAVIAAGLAIQTGADHKIIEEALSQLKGPKGRLEHVESSGKGDVFIDYAHKPAALETCLESLRPYVKGKLIVVFGCGGDRDTEKRPMMGEIAARLADKVIVTDDNPRTENAAAIRKQIMATASGATEIANRGDAIAAAVAELGDGDVLLVAGKGHEDYQIIGEEKLPFSDHEMVLAAAEA